MLEKRIAAARQVAATLTPTERALDETLAHTAGLNRLLIETGIEVGTGIALGQSAISCFGDAYAHLIKARACFADGHAELRRVQTQLGLDPFAVGDSSICPDEAEIVLADERNFKIVA